MTHNQHTTTTTTVSIQMSGRTILDCIMHKLPATRKYYRVYLFVPDNGIPIIEYKQTNASSKKPKKSIQFADLLFADRRHDINEKLAFSIYTIDKTITFIPQDETTMNDWLSKIRELHSNIYPEFKRYDAIFEATLLDKGLAKTMNIQGQFRLALCKDSLDLIPLLVTPNPNSDHHQNINNNNNNHNHNNVNNNNNNHQQHHHLSSNHHHHHHNHLRFHKRHPLLSSRIIELVLRSIRRCGHTDSNFYIESGRHSQIGEGDLWMGLNKKSTARYLHELLLTTMKLASTTEDQFIYKTPRSRSGSSSDNAQRSQQSRSSSLICLATITTAAAAAAASTMPMPMVPPVVSTPTNTPANTISSIPMFPGNNNIDEDSGYLPMA